MGFKKNTPGGNAGCDACRVYPAWGIAHGGRIRRSRRIRQWRGADAGCDACRVHPNGNTCRADKAFTPHPPVALGSCRMQRLPRFIRPAEDCTCRADKAFTPHPPAVANYCLRKKSLYNINKCAALGEIRCPLLRASERGCNSPELVHRRLTPCRKNASPASGHHRDNHVTLHPFQTNQN